MTQLRATGNIAKAICDRCGFKFFHPQLRLERRNESNLMVCNECYDSIPDNLRWKGPFVREMLTWTRPEIPVDDSPSVDP